MKGRELGSLFEAIFHGKYKFSDFLEMSISENCRVTQWRSRRIYLPSRKLKDFQSFLNSVVFDHLPINSRVAFAYRRGVSAVDAVRPHIGGRVFFKTDFQNFFGSITDDLVRATVSGALTPVSDLDGYFDRIIELVTMDGHLPIGFSSSPVVSNACLYAFDNDLESRCSEMSMVYSRYADDIIISGKDGDVGGFARSAVLAAMHKIGPAFSLNEDKTKVISVGRKVKMLGLVILPNGKITVDKDLRSRVEYLLHFYVTDRGRLDEIFGDDIDVGLQQLAGMIGHVSAVDPFYVDKLRRKFGAVIVDSFLHKTFK